MGRQRRIDALMNLLAGATRAEWETVERALDVIDRALAS
jgi:hypothetical protein